MCSCGDSTPSKFLILISAFSGEFSRTFKVFVDILFWFSNTFCDRSCEVLLLTFAPAKLFPELLRRCLLEYFVDSLCFRTAVSSKY